MVARRAKGFNMRVVYYNRDKDTDEEKELGVEYLDLDSLLGQSDIVSLHVPLTSETRHLINKDSIAKMKNGVVIVNTARGGLIDTKALLKGLQSGKISGAGLDVFEGEKSVFDEQKAVLYGTSNSEDLLLLAENNLLFTHPNVVATPHIAFFTREALKRILDTDVENIRSFLSSGEPKFPIVSSSRFSPTGSGQASSSAPGAAKI